MKKTKKINQGFTIIEVLIVLAIAGLILAIVFLAVPALQRNSRNSSIKSDAASIMAGVNEFIANNGGQLPTGPNPITCTNGTVVIRSNVAGTTSAEAKVRGGTGCGVGAVAPGLGDINIAIGYKCNGNATVAAPRSVAAVFLIENTSTTTNPQCIES